MKTRTISRFIIMGDSLSDRGTMYNRELFGCLPMDYLSGLLGRSPTGSFTNGFAWSDDLCAMLASQFIIEELLAEGKLDRTDIADGIINGDRKINQRLDSAYTLDDDRFVQYKGLNFVRNYCEGGLMAHDYSWNLSSNPKRFFSRIILSSLKKMRIQLISDDKKNQTSALEKQQTLVIEWSGANDLVTVNAKPTISEVNHAIAARVKNVQKLIEQGYKNFILFNLPDLALTPRFFAVSDKKRQNAHDCSMYFNSQLQLASKYLREKYSDCTIDVFAISDMMTDAYNNPEKYGLDPKKLHIPYTESVDFEMREDNTSPAQGYMFWDDVHPSADVHAYLAERFYKKYSLLFNFEAPEIEQKQIEKQAV